MLEKQQKKQLEICNGKFHFEYVKFEKPKIWKANYIQDEILSEQLDVSLENIYELIIYNFGVENMHDHPQRDCGWGEKKEL